MKPVIIIAIIIAIIISIGIIAFTVAISDNVGDSEDETKSSETGIKTTDQMKAHITPVLGSGDPGCEETAERCYHPYHYKTHTTFQNIVFENTDNAAHTFTSGTPQDGPDGVFDTGLLMAGEKFIISIDERGEYDYYCMVHPWMTGKITV